MNEEANILRRNTRGPKQNFDWVCLSLFYILLIGSFTIKYQWVIFRVGGECFQWFNAVVVGLLYTLMLTAHWKAWRNRKSFVIPGDFADEIKRYLITMTGTSLIHRCRSCGLFKSYRTHHCRVCDRCVLKMDHHCPWIGNCIGLFNKKHYLLFVFYLFLLSVHTSFLLALHLYSMWQENPARALVRYVFLKQFHICMLSVFTAPTLVFSLLVLIRQLWGIHNDITGVELRNGERPIYTSRRKRIHNYMEVFGSPLSILWISPFHDPDIDIWKTKCSGFVRQLLT